MQVGLFEAFSGRFADGTPLDAVGEDQHRLLSVIDNLNRLFNHRQDALTHLPDYGLPDLSQTYRDNAEMILDFRFTYVSRASALVLDFRVERGWIVAIHP
jgi:predicted component of type VI protein secretion system